MLCHRTTRFGDCLQPIYPNELEVRDTNETCTVTLTISLTTDEDKQKLKTNVMTSLFRLSTSLSLNSLKICLNSSIVCGFGSLSPVRSNLELIVQLMSPPRNIRVLDSRKGQKKKIMIDKKARKTDDRVTQISIPS